MRGIILSGGAGTRLRPCTYVTSKQLLPVYDRPMIYYPLNTLIKAGIREILIIVAPERAGDYLRLLGSGRQFGVKFTYEIQDQPAGLAQALVIGDNFIDEENIALILGDNIFEGDFSRAAAGFKGGGQIFVKAVPDPERFGVAEMTADGRIVSLEEKPSKPRSNLAITGLYFFDSRAIGVAKGLAPSARGELEITDVQRWYLERGELRAGENKGEWLDAGTFDSLLAAQIFAKEKMQGKMIV